MNEISLTNQYWNYELNLAKIADSWHVSRKDLVEKAASFPLEIRNQVAGILLKQADLLQKGHSIKRANLTAEPIVDLTSYRQLLR